MFESIFPRCSVDSCSNGFSILIFPVTLELWVSEPDSANFELSDSRLFLLASFDLKNIILLNEVIQILILLKFDLASSNSLKQTNLKRFHS